MKYVPPLGSVDPNAPYTDPVDGTIPAAAIEQPMREIANVIASMGLMPGEQDLTQLDQAIDMKVAAMQTDTSDFVSLDRTIATRTPLTGGGHLHADLSLGIDASSLAMPEHVILRDAAGRAQVAEPNSGADIATKNYVDTLVGGLQSETGEYVPTARAIVPQAPLTGGGRLTQDLTLGIDAASEATPGYAVVRDAAGRAQVAEPAAGSDIATKEYVDALLATRTAFLYPGAFHDFFEQAPLPGWAVRDGSLLVNAPAAYPALWATLQLPANAWKCKSREEWDALSAAAGGVGGVPFFVLDLVAGTIRLPDTRGDYTEASGNGLGVGEWRPDSLQGHFHKIEVGLQVAEQWADPKSYLLNNSVAAGGNGSVFSGTRDFDPYEQNGTRQWHAYNIFEDSINGYGPPRLADRTAPRRFGMLPCVYVGGVS